MEDEFPEGMGLSEHPTVEGEQEMPEPEDFNELLGSLREWEVLAHKWCGHRRTLKDKLEATRLRNALTKALRSLRLHVFAFEDMCKELGKG